MLYDLAKPNPILQYIQHTCVPHIGKLYTYLIASNPILLFNAKERIIDWLLHMSDHDYTSLCPINLSMIPLQSCQFAFLPSSKSVLYISTLVQILRHCSGYIDDQGELKQW